MQKIKIALLAYGMSGKIFHAPFIHIHPGFELLGAWERSKFEIATDYNGAKSYSSLESIIHDNEIDWVVVNTPTITHFQYAKAALEAGKNIIVEKAFTTTVAEAKILQATAIEYGKKIAVFHNRRWDSDFLTVQKIINDNVLGNIVEMEIHFERYKPNLSNKLHKEQPNNGAGILKDLGPHIIDQALCLWGMPNSIFADIRITRFAAQVDDWFDIILFYPEKRVRLKASYLVRESSFAYIIHGTKGSFLKSRADVQETHLLQGKLPNTNDWGSEPSTEYGLLHTEQNGQPLRTTIPSCKGNYFYFYDQLYSSIIHHKPIPVTAEAATQVIQIIEAAIASNTQKCVINLANI